MARHTYHVTIHCSPDELFETLMDPDANRYWQTGVVQTRANTTGLATIGTTMTEVREFAGCRATIEYRLTELAWGERAVVELVGGPLRGTASYRCRPVAGGIEFTVDSDVTTCGSWRFAGRALAGVLAAELAVSCHRLKTMLEPRSDREAAGDLRVLSPAFSR